MKINYYSSHAVLEKAVDILGTLQDASDVPTKQQDIIDSLITITNLDDWPTFPQEFRDALQDIIDGKIPIDTLGEVLVSLIDYIHTS